MWRFLGCGTTLSEFGNIVKVFENPFVSLCDSAVCLLSSDGFSAAPPTIVTSIVRQRPFLCLCQYGFSHLLFGVSGEIFGLQ